MKGDVYEQCSECHQIALAAGRNSLLVRKAEVDTGALAVGQRRRKCRADLGIPSRPFGYDQV